MRKIITFLGVRPQLIKYKHQEQIYQGQVFAEAMYQFADFDEMLVFVTEKAYQDVFPVLEKLNDTRIKPVLIPNGENQAEMWQIFEQLTNSVNEQDVLTFDITHGLRSNPFLIFLAVAFLKSAKQVKIEAIYYGALELQPKNEKNEIIGPAPVIELSEFASLLDWMNATDSFIKTGDGRSLADLLKEIGEVENLERKLTKEEESIWRSKKRIQDAAESIRKVSQALLTTLVPNVEYASHLFKIALTKAEEDLAKQSPPYRMLAQRVKASYSTFALEKPMEHNLGQDLRIQLEMIRWYLDNGHIQQGITLMREWMVTAIGYKLGQKYPQILDHKTGRRYIEGTLNRAGFQLQLKITEPLSNDDTDLLYDDAFSVLSASKEITQFWGQLRDTRNLIDHAAMNKNWRDYKPQNVINKVMQHFKQFDQIATQLLTET